MLRPVLLIAHRGYSSEAPENTFAAFDLAIERGYKDIEFDVQLSRDNVPVIIHDETIDRTTNGHGNVADYTYKQLRTFDAGTWFDARFAGQFIPSFMDFLLRYKGLANLHIEIKSTDPDLPAHIISLLRETGWLPETEQVLPPLPTWRPRIIISSFDRAQLAHSVNEAPLSVIHELLVEEISDESMQWAADHGVRGYHPDGAHITPALVRKARHLKLHVGAWWNTREEQNVKTLSKSGARYAYVDAPQEHRRPPMVAPALRKLH